MTSAREAPATQCALLIELITRVLELHLVRPSADTSHLPWVSRQRSATWAQLGHGPVFFKGHVYVSDLDPDIMTVSVTICCHSTHRSLYLTHQFTSLHDMFYHRCTLHSPLRDLLIIAVHFTQHYCIFYSTFCVLSPYILLCTVLCFPHCW